MGLSSAMLAACGGGGGGGGGSDAKLNVDWTEATQSETYEGEDIPGILIHARVDNPDALSGKTLYLIAEIEDPELFQSTSVSIDSDERGGLLQLFGAKAPLGAKTYTGTILVRACLDAACHEELTVTGGRVGYQIEVKKGLVLSAEAADLSADFGVMPAAEIIDVSLPADVVSWKIEPTDSVNFASFKVEPFSDAQGAHVRVAPRSLWLPEQGTYEYAKVTAVTASGGTLVRGLELKQTTGPVADRYWAFQQPQVTFTISETSGGGGVYNPELSSALLPRRDSDRFHHLGTTYEWPVQANDNPMRSIWLSADLYDEGTTTPSDSYYINLVASRCYSGDCLPQGTYKAVMHFRYSPEGAPEELVDLNVTLNVTP